VPARLGIRAVRQASRNKIGGMGCCPKPANAAHCLDARALASVLSDPHQEAENAGAACEEWREPESEGALYAAGGGQSSDYLAGHDSTKENAAQASGALRCGTKAS
jgi:hypothetical protein